MIDHTPHGHWKTLTFIGALRQTGITSPMVFDCPINGNIFHAWAKQCLLSTLKPGDIVVMDNLASHKNPIIRKLIKSKGARLFYLPPYSPDLNPIENCFSKIKSWLRKMKERTINGILSALKSIIKTISITECNGYFKHTGYAT